MLASIFRTDNRAAAFTLLLLLIITVIPANGQQTENGDILVLLADFDGPDPEGIPITETLHSWLQQVGSEENSLNIERLNEVLIFTPDNFTDALEIGMENGADLVIWGIYDLPGTHARVDIAAVCCSGSGTGSVMEFNFYQEGTFPLSELVPGSEPPDRIKFVADVLAGYSYISREDYAQAILNINRALLYGESMPDDIHAMAYSLRSLVKLVWMGDLTGAASDAERAIELQPDNPQHYLRRAYCNHTRGDYQSALRDYLAAIELDPSDPEILSDLSVLYQEMGDYESSIAVITEAINLAPDTCRYLNTRGYTYNNLGDYEAAVEDISRSLELNPVYPTGWANLGCAQRELGMIADAVQSFDNAIEYQTDPALLSSYLCDRAYCNELRMDNESAIADYREGLSLYPGTAANYSRFAWLLMQVEEYEEAFQNYSTALDMSPDDINYLCNRALCSYNLMDNQAAIEDLTTANSIDPTALKATDFDLLGRAFAEEGDLATAIDCFTRALELETEPERRSWLLSNRGRCFNLSDDLQSYMEDMAAAIELNSSESSFYSKHGEACYLLNMNDEAIESFNTAIELGLPDESLSMCLYERGRIYLDINEFERAIDDLTASLQYDSGMYDAYFFRGIAHLSLNDLESCCEDMNHYLEVGSDPEYRAGATEFLESVE